MLEARIFFARAQYLRALTVLEKLLPRLNLSVASEKILAADALSLSASACRELGFIGDAVAKFRLSAKLEGDSRQACAEMSNALFAACHDENFSRADFDELYAEYKTFLSDVKVFEPKSYVHKKNSRRIRVGGFRLARGHGVELGTVDRTRQKFFRDVSVFGFDGGRRSHRISACDLRPLARHQRHDGL